MDAQRRRRVRARKRCERRGRWSRSGIHAKCQDLDGWMRRGGGERGKNAHLDQIIQQRHRRRWRARVRHCTSHHKSIGRGEHQREHKRKARHAAKGDRSGEKQPSAEVHFRHRFARLQAAMHQNKAPEVCVGDLSSPSPRNSQSTKFPQSTKFGFATSHFCQIQNAPHCKRIFTMLTEQ